MDKSIFALPALCVIILASLYLLIGESWQRRIIALALQYCGVFVMVSFSWPVFLAFVKLITGWMAAAELAMAISMTDQVSFKINNKSEESRGRSISPWLAGSLYRLSAAGMVGLVVISVASKITDFIYGISLEQTIAALFLVGCGLMQLGFSSRPFPVLLGLLTVLSGFEILYASVETSTLVAGLLAVINLGIATVGAYLLTSSRVEAIE